MINFVNPFLFLSIFFAMSESFFFCSSNNDEYCKIKRCSPTRHTMCLYYADKPSQECSRLSSSGLNGEEIYDVIKIHNKFRFKVAYGHEERGNPGPQFPAEYMPNLQWDHELAEIAQRWANQCKFGHDECRHVDRFHVGQNVAQLWNSNSSLLTIKNLIQGWYEEVENFDRNRVHHYQFDYTTGHYTQIVWANTKKIGCGMVRYTDKGLHTAYLVCNYGPAGNYDLEPVYKISQIN